MSTVDAATLLTLPHFSCTGSRLFLAEGTFIEELRALGARVLRPEALPPSDAAQALLYELGVRMRDDTVRRTRSHAVSGRVHFRRRNA